MVHRNLLNTAEAAAYIGVKKSYLAKLMMNKAITYYKPNVLKTDDIHPPKTGISVHFSCSLS